MSSSVKDFVSGDVLLGSGEEYASAETKDLAVPIADGWFLGFDGSCPTCVALAADVEHLSSGKINAVDLGHPTVIDWRKATLGPSPAWTPTLFRLEGGLPRAWVGKAMLLRMSVLLGPRQAWKLASILGSLTKAPQREESAVPVIGRRKVVTGLAGIAAGFTLVKIAEEETKANTPTECGVEGSYVGYRYPPTFTVKGAGANCRNCPYNTSSINTTLGSGASFQAEGYTTIGSYFNGSSTWVRSNGPRGCWVHRSLLNP